MIEEVWSFIVNVMVFVAALDFLYFCYTVPWLNVRREGALFLKLLYRALCYYLMMLRVDECLNEYPGPLQGPRIYFTRKLS